MRWLSCSLIICSILAIFCLPKINATKIPLAKLGLQNNYNGIVRDLIKNWESPIVYLRQLGFLPKDYEDTSKIKPNLDALISRMERDDEGESLSQEAEKNKQLFSETQENQKKKKRENVLKKYLKDTEKKQRNQREVEIEKQQLDMKQPTLSAAKIYDQSTSNLQLELGHHLLDKQQKEQLQPPQKSVDFLQQMVVKTSPQQNGAASKLASTSVMLKNLKIDISRTAAGDINPLSITNQASSNEQIEAPHYLNWNIQNHKLEESSPKERKSYVDKLVRIFVKKQENASE